MARPERLELPTFWFPPQADSIQLSCGAYIPEFVSILRGPSQTSEIVPRFIASAREENSSQWRISQCPRWISLPWWFSC